MHVGETSIVKQAGTFYGVYFASVGSVLDEYSFYWAKFENNKWTSWKPGKISGLQNLTIPSNTIGYVGYEPTENEISIIGTANCALPCKPELWLVKGGK
jgi:hypothetical protein